MKIRRWIASGLTGVLWLVPSPAGPAAGAAPGSASERPVGVIVGGQGLAPDIVGTLQDLGARWVRVNGHLDGNDQDLTRYLDAGLGMVITLDNHDPSNADTTYGTPEQWPNAGFPFLSKEAYEQDIRDSLAPVLPYVAEGAQVWVQAENEVGDASLNPNARFWRGTTDQYLTQLQALYETVKDLDPSIPVVLSSFPSESLDAVLDPDDPHHEYSVARLTRLLTEGQYDAADLHFYGCVEDVPAKVRWVVDHMPGGKRWISTESGGPDSRCPTTPATWQQDPAGFEQLQAEQVPERLGACVDEGGSVCLWFSLYDARGESEVFRHLGLLDQSVIPPRKKPAYDAFQAFAAGSRGERTISIEASESRVSGGERARISGEMEGDPTCIAGQEVELQAKRGDGRFKAVEEASTRSGGTYRFRVAVERSQRYRVVSPKTAACERAESRVIKVRVR